jgi:hypothetical protein
MVIISLTSINQLIFLMKNLSVIFEVETEFFKYYLQSKF